MAGRVFTAKQLGMGAAKKPHKYGAAQIEVDGIKFSSRREAKRWSELKVLERGGQIEGVERQVKLPLLGHYGPILTPTGKQAHYVADFAYLDTARHKIVFEDAKGFPTPEYKLKRAILLAQGIEIKEV